MNISFYKKISLLLVFCLLLCPENIFGQEILIRGHIVDNLSDAPLEQVMVTITNESDQGATQTTVTGSDGNFEFKTSKGSFLLTAQLPGYHNRSLRTKANTELQINMVGEMFPSMDEIMITPTGELRVADKTSSVAFIDLFDNNSMVSSVDQELYSKVPGLSVYESSGMPGHWSLSTIRGFTSLMGRNEPLIVIDGMIHESNYNNSTVIDGFYMNPLDLIDIIDVSSITILKNAQPMYGSKASNGVISINTLQKSETSTSMKFSFQGGVASMPTYQETMNADQFRQYLNGALSSQNLTLTEIDAMYPWLNGSGDGEDFVRYRNNTNWQEEVFRIGKIEKYHFFLKGGDDIATYNISTGYVNHNGIVNDTKYSRYNLHLNGKINLTQRFSITPIAKLGLATSKLQEQGYNQVTNPITAALLKPAIMAPFIDNQNSEGESFLDDVGVFNISNPTAIVSKVLAENVNFQFLTSAEAKYEFSRKIILSSTIGMNYANSKANIFIPDKGLASIDSARSTARLGVTFFHSLQNHTRLEFKDILEGAHRLSAMAGMNMMQNYYEYDRGTDLNAATDDFTSLGQGAEDQFLRTSTGGRRALNWIAYYANVDYSFTGRYFLSAGISIDETSAVNERNRQNIYPSVSGAWKISSEDFLSGQTWLDLLKVRASYGLTGNTYSSVYDYSQLYYSQRKLNESAYLVRVSVPNPDMEIEKKSMGEIGLDLVVFNQRLGVELNYFMDQVNNLIIPQKLTPAYGYTTYYNNAGSLMSSGIETGLNYHAGIGDFTWSGGVSFTSLENKITSLNLGEGSLMNNLLTSIEGAELITAVDNPMFSYYGYQVNGTYSGAEAGTVIGPNGGLNKEGDVRYAGDEDGIIDESDKQIIGNPHPTYYGSVLNTFRYKNFSLELNFSFSGGNELYNYVAMKTQSAERLAGLNTDGLVSFEDSYGNYVFSDQWIENGAYIKLRDFTLSYTFNKTNRIYKNLIVYARGINLYTLTEYSGYSPEFLFSTNPEYLGVDYGKIPQTSSFVIGLKVDL